MKDYEKKIRMDYRDVDRFGDVRFDSFLQMLGTVSMYHTVSLGMEPDYMEKRGLMWVLHQWCVHLEESRYYARVISFRTFAVFESGIYSHRYYTIHDDEGKQVGTAVAQWIVIDLERRRMSRIPKDVEELYYGNGPKALTEAQDDLVSSLDARPLRKRRDAVWTHEKLYEVRFSEIDPNGHVNNVKYVEWALESLKTPTDEGFLIDHHPLDLTIVYKKERMPLGHVTARTELRGTNSYHEIIDEDGSLLSIIEMEWRKRD